MRPGRGRLDDLAQGRWPPSGDEPWLQVIAQVSPGCKARQPVASVWLCYRGTYYLVLQRKRVKLVSLVTLDSSKLVQPI